MREKINSVHISVIARIHNSFTSKFGIPRQSGLIKEVESKIVFEPEFRNPDAVRGLDKYSHLWLIWQFSEAADSQWTPTVRPPKLGGNTRMGVFATRSPYRPNSLGLSSVTLKRIDIDAKDGPALYVSGADLLDGTPIFDIKPYLPYTDSHPEALGGFAVDKDAAYLKVNFADDILDRIQVNDRVAVKALLAQDPRPGYQNEPERIYGMTYGMYNIKFRVCDGTLDVIDVEYV